MVRLNSSLKDSNTNQQQQHDDVLESGYRRPSVQWYPGHIAKAERQLSETLKAVDVVVEVRDARACKATAHPRVGEWCAGRPRIVVLTHLDMIPKPAANAWKRAYDQLGAERWDDAPINTQVANQAQQARDQRFQYNDNKKKSKSKHKKQQGSNAAITPVEQVLFVNAKQGQGIHALHRAIFKAGAHVQERRERRGLNPRALRVGIIGYPNVGKVRGESNHNSAQLVQTFAKRKETTQLIDYLFVRSFVRPFAEIIGGCHPRWIVGIDQPYFGSETGSNRKHTRCDSFVTVDSRASGRSQNVPKKRV